MNRYLLVLFLASAGLATAQHAKVTIAGSEVRQQKSTSTGRDYDLYIHLPANYAKETKKYPTLYVLDAQWDFKLMDSVLGGLVYDKFVPEMIMVGITYSGENPDYEALRARDLTPDSGDAPKFLKFLKTELFPYVETTFRSDPAHRVLQGNSFAGLFTLYALFSDPALFSAYLADSPAVTFGNRYAFKQESDYAAAHKDLPARLYIAVGGAEPLSGPVQEFMKAVQSHNYQGLKLETRVIEGERHSGNKPEAFNRGLRFLFQ